MFKINRNYATLGLTKPENLYIMLKSIYSYNKKDILIALDLFNEICLSINSDFFNKYIYSNLKNDEFYTMFKNTHMYHNYFTGEESKMSVNKSNIRIKSNVNDNIFLINLENLTHLFVCDFINDYYRFFSNKSYLSIIKK